jgi:thiol peroxidase
MATLAIGGNPVHTNAELPKSGDKAINFSLVKTDLSTVSLNDFDGKRLILNIFPSVDTGTCATSVREFNKRASGLTNTAVLCISRDLPFAQKRFCGAEGIENVEVLSDFNTGEFGKHYGVEMIDGKMVGLHARAIVVLDEGHNVIHTELVPNISDEPNYDAAIAAL